MFAFLRDGATNLQLASINDGHAYIFDAWWSQMYSWIRTERKCSLILVGVLCFVNSMFESPS